MADDSTKTIWATFETREAADRAIEHLVQQYGIARADVFVEAEAPENTTGTSPSGGDSAHREGDRRDAPLNGAIKVSADVSNDAVTDAEQAFRDAGARNVMAR
jgi:hypothetical protein